MIEVVVGIIRNNSREVFIAKRQKNQFMSDFWELPGGKVENGEDHGDGAAEASEICNFCQPFDLASHSAVANLVGYWRMGDGDTFSTISDNASSYDGTMTNMTAGNITGKVP